MKFLFLFLIIFQCLPVYSYDELCESVRIKKLKKLKLNANEKLLLCGDKKAEEYKHIPAYQAKYFLTGFLQSRGHLNPDMEIKNGVLYCDPRKVSKVKKIRLKIEDGDLKNEVQTELRHLYNKRVLTTNTLNSIEGEALALFRNRGYPCTKTSGVADIDNWNVFIDAKQLEFHEFGSVDKEPIEGLRDNALDRFYPFTANQPFNADLLKLTEKRMTRSEVVQGTYFVDKCENGGFDLKQSFILGPPRTLKFGLGASTELGPKVSFRWAHNRYKSMASQFALNANASFRSQTVNATADMFVWKNEPRRSIYSVVELTHENQVDYEQTIYSIRPAIKWTRDSEHFNKLYTLGPSFEGGTYYSNGNADSRSYKTGLIDSYMQWMSHEYELFDVLPQRGQLYTLNMDYRAEAFGFFANDLVAEFNTVQAYHITNWNRGTLIGAGRLNLATSWVDTEKASLAILPPGVKFFGGGSDDIRGFYLNTLPDNGGLGALTKMMAKMELRRTYLFIPSLEAFAFLDGGYFSEKSWTRDPQLYYSPGAGLRWLSPFGLVQGYVARGLRSNPYKDSGNFYYAGIGGTF